MAIGKKGVIYLLLSIAFVSIFIVLFLILNEFDQQDRVSTAETRVRTMNDFVKDLHEDMRRVSFITGFRALLGLEQYLTQEGIFFSSQQELEDRFREAFTNGSINGSASGLMANSSLNEYLLRVQSQASTLDISTNITILNVTLRQTDPWTLEVELVGSFNISDNKMSSWWLYTRNLTTELPIINLKDPLYAVNSLGRVPNTIRNYTLPPDGFVNDTDNSTDTLQEFVEGSYYRVSNDAPSFLQRFFNDLSSDTNGIESVVHLPSFSDQGLTTFSDRSVVDHIYFSSSPDNSSDRCSIDGMIFAPDWFRIDFDHAVIFEIDNFTYSTC